MAGLLLLGILLCLLGHGSEQGGGSHAVEAPVGGIVVGELDKVAFAGHVEVLVQGLADQLGQGCVGILVDQTDSAEAAQSQGVRRATHHHEGLGLQGDEDELLGLAQQGGEGG
eukprot:203214_1